MHVLVKFTIITSLSIKSKYQLTNKQLGCVVNRVLIFYQALISRQTNMSSKMHPRKIILHGSWFQSLLTAALRLVTMDPPRGSAPGPPTSLQAPLILSRTSPIKSIRFRSRGIFITSLKRILMNWYTALYQVKYKRGLRLTDALASIKTWPLFVILKWTLNDI